MDTKPLKITHANPEGEAIVRLLCAAVGNVQILKLLHDDALIPSDLKKHIRVQLDIWTAAADHYNLMAHKETQIRKAG